MENQKLELMLNKIVEVNVKKESCQIKGFLYKNPSNYYIKITEIVSGRGLEIGDVYNLMENSEFQISVSEKPKLMRVSLKS